MTFFRCPDPYHAWDAKKIGPIIDFILRFFLMNGKYYNVKRFPFWTAGIIIYVKAWNKKGELIS